MGRTSEKIVNEILILDHLRLKVEVASLHFSASAPCSQMVKKKNLPLYI